MSIAIKFCNCRTQALKLRHEHTKANAPVIFGQPFDHQRYAIIISHQVHQNARDDGRFYATNEFRYISLLPTIPRTSLSARTSSLTPSRPLIVPKIELRKITLQMLRTDMMVGPSNPPLEDRKITLNRIGVSIAANIFANAMIDGLVASKFPPTRGPPSSLMTCVSALICACKMGRKARADGGNVMAANIAAALH